MGGFGNPLATPAQKGLGELDSLSERADDNDDNNNDDEDSDASVPPRYSSSRKQPQQQQQQRDFELLRTALDDVDLASRLFEVLRSHNLDLEDVRSMREADLMGLGLIKVLCSV
jgi:hypothetical protein